MPIDPSELAHQAALQAQNDFIWKGVTGLATAGSLALVTLFGWLMRSKDNQITSTSTENQLLKTQLVQQQKEAQTREDALRAEYEAKLEIERRARSIETRRHTRTIRMAQEAIALASEAPPRAARVRVAQYTDEDAEESTGVLNVRGEAGGDQIARELERLRREKQARLDEELQDFLGPSSHPPPKPYRGKLPSGRRRG